MGISVLVVGDPIIELKPGRETTLALIAEANTRGFNVDYCTAPDLCQKNGNVFGLVRSMKLTGNFDNYFDLGEERVVNLTTYDTVLLRSNPNGYKRMNTSYLLDPIADDVLITNDPRGIREVHGKFFTGLFPDFIVPYAIVEHERHFSEFLNEHNDIIVKPVNGFGGKGIQRIKSCPADMTTAFKNLHQQYGGEPFILQEYIPDAARGDKRIILFDGEPVCSLLRVPKDADSLANVTQGATVQKSELSPREQALCREIGPILRDYGLFFVGLDMLGDYLSEINLISVGTIVPANNLYNIKLEEKFWDMLEEKIDTFKSDKNRRHG